MVFHVFDLSKVDLDQVREVLTHMGKSGMVGRVYLWINKYHGNTYVGSSTNLRSRLSGYFSLKYVHGIIGLALLKYGLVNFLLLIVIICAQRNEGGSALIGTIDC